MEKRSGREQGWPVEALYLLISLSVPDLKLSWCSKKNVYEEECLFSGNSPTAWAKRCYVWLLRLVLNALAIYSPSW